MHTLKKNNIYIFYHLPSWVKIVMWILFILSSKSYAQQLPMTSHDYMNPILYNPAEIGQHNYVNVNLHARRQWVGIQGGPETYILTVDGALESKKIGLALIVCNDVTDILSRLTASAGYRYSITLPGEDHGIRLGLMGSLIQNRINFDKIHADNTSDPSLFSNTESQTGVDANAGIQYRLKNLKVGFSAYQLLGSHLQYQDQIDDKSLTFRFIRHFFSMASYDYQCNDKFQIVPRMLVKSAQGMPAQFDFGVYTAYSKKLWGGITWQHHYAVSFAIGGNFYDRYSIGYSYDFSIGAISKYTSGSHEIVFAVKLFNPRPAGEVAPGTGSPDDEMEKLKRISKEQDEELEKLRTENKLMKKELVSTNQNIESQKGELLDLQKIFSNDSASIREVIKKYSTSLDQLGLDNPRRRYKKVGSSYIDTTVESTFKETKYYVVMGTFKNYKDARLLQRVLAREINVKTLIAAQDNNVFLVYTEKFSDSYGVKGKIKKHMHNLEKKGAGKYIQGDIWIYKTRE
jgi:type IX secretion system PorP/SprF family membrane protein